MRKKRELIRFANWAFGRLGLRPIPIVYAPAPALCDPDGVTCFGVYAFDIDLPAYKSKIWIAYRYHPKFNVLGFLAHEIIHYHQNAMIGIEKMGYENAEKDAEERTELLLAEWVKRVGL